jgi:hypothetical protein
MNRDMKQPTRSGAVLSDEALGRVTFRLRVGVTGHQQLPDEERLAAVVRRELGRLIHLLDAGKSTTVELAVISQLANGADRLVVRQVLKVAEERGQQARLEVVLPMPHEAYAQAEKFNAASRQEFDDLRERASLVSDPHHVGHNPEHAYEAAAQRLISSCDILLALWDGRPTGGRDRTAETFLRAASAGKPCVWIPTDPDTQVTDNFGPGRSYDFYQKVADRAAVPADRAVPPLKPRDPPEDVLAPLLESLKLLKRYNGERLPAKFGQRLRKEFNFPGGEDDWIAPFFLRATMLAEEYQTRFAQSVRALTLLAIVAAALLGVHLGLNSSPAWDWSEVASLVAITVIFLVMHRGEFHDRWVSYRFLAERLRSARYLMPAGVDFRLFRPTVTAYIERHPSDWIQRTFDEFWQSEAQHRHKNTPETIDDALKRRLGDEWIGSQICYHKKRYKEHLRWQRILRTTILGLFAAAVICAILDASAVASGVMGFLSVLLTAAAASLGALLTVRQHQQLAERSEQISRDLQEAQWQITNTANGRLAVSSAARAARIMAEENEDWLGALWFLDVEHPG